MSSLPSRKCQKKHVHWADHKCGSECTCSSFSSQADSSDSSLALKPPTHDQPPTHDRLRAQRSPMKASVSMITIAVPLIPALHPVLSYFVFNWNVRATQFPDTLPKPARDEPAFPSLAFPIPITIHFDTPLGASACAINPLQRSDGKPVPISVGRVLACISRELYTAIEPTALYAGHALLPAVRQAAASRPYDPQPGRTKPVPRNIDLYPVLSAQRDAPLFFWYIEVQHCVGGTVRLVARFGYKPLKAVA